MNANVKQQHSLSADALLLASKMPIHLIFFFFFTVLAKILGDSLPYKNKTDLTGD